jgi:low affinity Fe/Cu permease
MKNLFILLYALFFFHIWLQPKKTLQTKFITDKIEIDGKLDESIWKSAAIASDFITFEPDNGKPIPENRKPK